MKVSTLKTQLSLLYFITVIFSANTFALSVTYVEQDFINSSPISTTESFDRPHEWYDSRAVVFDEVLYETVWGAWFVADTIGSSANSVDRLSVGADRYVSHLGFKLQNGGIFPEPHMVMKVLEIDGTNTHFDLVGVADVNSYYGFSSATGIQEIRIFDYPQDSSSSNWTFDNVSHSPVMGGIPLEDGITQPLLPVPELSSYYLILIGLGMLFVYRAVSRRFNRISRKWLD